MTSWSKREGWGSQRRPTVSHFENSYFIPETFLHITSSWMPPCGNPYVDTTCVKCVLLFLFSHATDASWSQATRFDWRWVETRVFFKWNENLFPLLPDSFKIFWTWQKRSCGLSGSSWWFSVVHFSIILLFALNLSEMYFFMFYFYV